MLFTVNTGILTSVCAIASLIILSSLSKLGFLHPWKITVIGQAFLYIAFFFCLGRLYTNLLPATLSARKMICGAGENIHSMSDNFSLSLREFANAGTVSSRGNNSGNSFLCESARPTTSLALDEQFNENQHHQRACELLRPWS